MMATFAAGLLAAGCGGGGYGGGTSSMPTSSGTTTGASSTPDVVITIAGMSFTPSSVTVQSGQTVVWKNTDSIAHTATQHGGGFDTGAIPAGATSKAIAITGTGALHYHCEVHPVMVGSLNGTSTGGGY
jgi:plastocyanin